MLGLAFSLRSSSLPRLAFVAGGHGHGRRDISRSALTMGYCHSFDYNPEKYELPERKQRFQLVSDEVALLYANLPEEITSTEWNQRDASVPPDVAEKSRRYWLMFSEGDKVAFTSDLVEIAYFVVSRDKPMDRMIKVGMRNHFDLIVCASLISFHRHMPLAFTYTSEGGVDGENLWNWGINHYQFEIGDPLGHEPDWAEQLVRTQFKVEDEKYYKELAAREAAAAAVAAAAAGLSDGAGV